MKVLIVCSHLWPSEGWGTEALQSIQGLRSLGHDVRALVHRASVDDSCMQYPFLPPPLSVLRHPLAWLKTVHAFRKVLREWQPDIIHIMTEPYALGAFFLRTTPLVLTVNGTYALLPLTSIVTRYLMMRAYRRSVRVLSISRYTARRLDAALQSLDQALATLMREKTVIWTLGTPHLPAMSHTAPHKNSVKQILFVGGLKARKGVLQIIEACGVFARVSRVPFHLHLIGSPAEEAYDRMLRSRTDELGLSSCVTFHGHVSERELTERYAEADLFMMLSISEAVHFEGYGLVFLEANMRGTAVIGPRDSGCEDAISDGRSGYLVSPHDAEAVAERMRWILEENRINPAECRAWAEEHSIQRQATELESQYLLVHRV